MQGFRDACMHEMYGCQPAICALAVAKTSRPVKMQWLPGARVAPPGAPRKGQSHGTTGRLFAARARRRAYSIDFSQNLDTKTADVR